jgi:hypothetical protein
MGLLLCLDMHPGTRVLDVPGEGRLRAWLRPPGIGKPALFALNLRELVSIYIH